jgi:hypothetical protein
MLGQTSEACAPRVILNQCSYVSIRSPSPRPASRDACRGSGGRFLLSRTTCVVRAAKLSALFRYPVFRDRILGGNRVCRRGKRLIQNAPWRVNTGRVFLFEVLARRVSPSQRRWIFSLKIDRAPTWKAAQPYAAGRRSRRARPRRKRPGGVRGEFQDPGIIQDQRTARSSVRPRVHDPGAAARTRSTTARFFFLPAPRAGVAPATTRDRAPAASTPPRRAE